VIRSKGRDRLMLGMTDLKNQCASFRATKVHTDPSFPARAVRPASEVPATEIRRGKLILDPNPTPRHCSAESST
jgi:hypothetical protein